MSVPLDDDGLPPGGPWTAASAQVLGAGRMLARGGRAVAGSRAARSVTFAGLAAAVVAGAAARRRVRPGSGRTAELAEPGEGSLPEPGDDDLVPLVGGEPTTVVASDGVPLHVEVVGDPGAALTLVFIHGFCVSLDFWTFQRRELAECGRLVFYDQRAHGLSGASDVAACTIEQLGDDLYQVLAEVVPTGPVILVGHSMGGMTILALADAHAELFGGRIVGVGLVSTSAGSLATVTFGLPVAATKMLRTALPGLAVGMRYAPTLLERGRRHGSQVAWAATRRIGFGSAAVGPPLVSFLEKMVAATPLHVMAAFLPALINHDKIAAAAALVTTPTLILVGDADVMTPLEHSRTLSELLPEADLVVLAGAGHAVTLERPNEVNEALRALVNRATARPRGLPRPPGARTQAAPARHDRGPEDLRTRTS
ncbi:alpha/beta fold hydrolase [Frankia sp. CiP3]|uniref:alpha/beta fold hydrolase n=1 Tax=Frankia sp. CiP3 TaxID=2880971 RepID=UPI001EF6E956|nr:alpha/beta hydrolase [Frankia sp. CiP3]